MLTHAILPALLLGMLFAGLEWSGADVWLSAHFYDPIAQQWPYKEHWLIQKVFHKGGRLIFFAIVASILVMLQRSFKVDSALKAYRLSLMYLLLASISGPLIIMFLKNHTHIYCPWDLQLFGSFKPYIRWLDELSPALPVGHCFPAAHAGSGFAFVSLYFFFLATRARYKFYGLGFGLILGELYGFTQQMRGAHFLSHDIAALAVCWFMAVSLFMVFFRKQVQWQ
ncbi:MAG: phosphatase PAP2 family protein [Methylococcaceae bacterium]|nr:phosphatase PAP2 family protein [Methylococcaceae bacterium]